MDLNGKNCCDYDGIFHYQPGEFSVKYKTDLSGKLSETDPDPTLSDLDIKSFKDCRYQTCITLEPIVLYRIYGRYNPGAAENPRGSGLRGRYVSTEFAESIIDAKMRLALAPGWLNTKMYEAKLLVPKGVKLSLGIVASVTPPGESELPGGAEQLLLPRNWDENWILGYRRVTARQLQAPPQYWPHKPDEVVVGKNNLYPHVCPLCGYEQTRKLGESEQFEFVGIKSNHYTMKWQCLNPACAYYW